MTELEFAPGHVFFKSGDQGDYAYELIDGQVELLAGAAEKLNSVGSFGPGEVFGEMALVEERPRVLTAVAIAGGRAVAMNRDEFEHLLTHDPARARRYLRSLFERLRSLTARLGADAEVAASEAAATPAGPAPVAFPSSYGKTADWVVALHPLTSKAAETIPDEGLAVGRFPLRIGRVTGAHENDALDLNDLWLLDEAPFNVSRNHLEIDVDRKGVVVRDRGSHLGCRVNDEWIGGRTQSASARLKDGDNVLVIGSPDSPYQYRIGVSRAVTAR